MKLGIRVTSHLVAWQSLPQPGQSSSRAKSLGGCAVKNASLWVQRHCECLLSKGVIINGAVQKKGPLILQGVGPVEAPQRFYLLLGSNGTRDHGPVTAERQSRTLRPRWELPLVGKGKVTEF